MTCFVLKIEDARSCGVNMPRPLDSFLQSLISSLPEILKFTSSSKVSVHINKILSMNRKYNLDIKWYFYKSIYIIYIYTYNEITFFFCWLRKKFLTVQNYPNKRNIFYLIELVSKWKTTNSKWYTSFMLFFFLRREEGGGGEGEGGREKGWDF